MKITTLTSCTLILSVFMFVSIFATKAQDVPLTEQQSKAKPDTNSAAYQLQQKIGCTVAQSVGRTDTPIKIGGVEDHVHVFSSFSKNIAFADLIGRLKGA